MPARPNIDIRLLVASSFDDVNAVMQLAKWRLFWVTMLASGLAAIVLWPVTGLVVRPGISEDEIPRLKERFFQMDENRAHTGQNAGLGLAIADQLVELLGGTLTLELRSEAQFVAIVQIDATSDATRANSIAFSSCSNSAAVNFS